MDVTGLGVVVTGAAGGIGRAIAEMLVGRGARVVVNDLDEQATRRTVEQIGAVPVAGDAAGRAGVAELVAGATARLGRIDVYFANAGVDGGGGLDSSEQQWATAMEVNVLAHVRAAELLVPQWLTSGGGRLVVTASAAGLLCMVGNAPYSVSKHAAVAFAEWLSITYGGRGVVVAGDLSARGADAHARRGRAADGRAWARRRARAARRGGGGVAGPAGRPLPDPAAR